MSVPVSARRLSPDEGQHLLRLVRRGRQQSIRVRRGLMILASSSGTPVPAIARLLAADEDTVRDVIHTFNQRGLAALDPHWEGGAPRRISDHDVAFVLATARTRPKKLGLPFTHFSIRKLACYLQGRYGRHDRRQAPARQIGIRRERLRQILAGHDITFQRTRTWKESTDPGLRGQAGRHRRGHHIVPATVFRVRLVRAAVDPPLPRDLLGRPQPSRPATRHLQTHPRDPLPARLLRPGQRQAVGRAAPPQARRSHPCRAQDLTSNNRLSKAEKGHSRVGDRHHRRDRRRPRTTPQGTKRSNQKLYRRITPL